jgi:hypothetical protein
MKLVRYLGAVLLVLGAVSAVPAHAQTTCNTSSLSGDYSIRITGAIVAGPQADPVNEVNLTHFGPDSGGSRHPQWPVLEWPVLDVQSIEKREGIQKPVMPASPHLASEWLVHDFAHGLSLARKDKSGL